MDNYAIGMIIGTLEQNESNQNPQFRDYRKVLITLVNNLSKKFKKDSYISILCDVYNDDFNDTSSNSIKKYLIDKDMFHSSSNDISSNDAEVLMRLIPLTFYFSYHNYISEENKFKYIEDIVKLTHSHPISVIGSMIYYSLLKAYIEDKVLDDEMEKVFAFFSNSIEYKDWMTSFEKFVHIDRIKVLKREDVSNSTYVLDAITLCLWSVLSSHDYTSAIERIKEMTSNKLLILLTAALSGAKYGLHKMNIDLNEYRSDINSLKTIINNYEEF